MSIMFACSACGSPSISLPETLDDEAVVHCGRCSGVVGRWGPFKALARRLESESARPLPAPPAEAPGPNGPAGALS